MDVKQILLLVGFAVYYWIRARNKKAAKQNKAPQPQKQQRQRKISQPRPTQTQQEAPREKTLEEILRELAGEQVTPEPPAPEPDRRERVKIKHVEATQDTTSRAVSAENSPRRVEPPKKTTAKVESSAGSNDVEFDLRQAVINDAILTRPHF